MKTFILVLSGCLSALFFICANENVSASSSVSYYISPGGNDNNSGTSASSPWQTLDKVNSGRFNPGDKVLFERGGKWYGQLKIPASGITIGAYGSGDKPVIHGWKTLTGWTNEGGGLYSITDVSLLDAVGILKIDGQIKNKGRFPKTDDPSYHNGWHTITSAHENRSITSNISGTPNYTGGEIVRNARDWVIEVCNITNHSGNTIHYSGASNYDQSTSLGFFVQNHINCLTEFGDWMYNSATKKITMYFGEAIPANHEIKVSSIDILVLTNNKNIEFQNISFQGSNRASVWAYGWVENLKFNNCDFLFSGMNAIYATTQDPDNVWRGFPNGLTVNECLFEDTKVSGFDSHLAHYVTITNNVFRRTYLDPGSAPHGDPTGVPISLGGGHDGANHTITGNRIYDSGSHAIAFRASHVRVENNYISNFGLTHTDVGGIYCWGVKYGYQGAEPHVDRIVRKNIVIQDPEYRTPTLQRGQPLIIGIYHDNGSPNLITTDNIIMYTGIGIFGHSSYNVKCKRNIIYKSRWWGTHWSEYYPEILSENWDFQDNVIYDWGDAAISFRYQSGKDVPKMIAFDNNYYIKPGADPDKDVYVQLQVALDIPFFLTLREWKNYKQFGYDTNTKTSPTKSKASAVYYNNTNEVQNIDIGTNRIDIYGNPVTKRIIPFEPFEGMLVLEGEPGPESLSVAGSNTYENPDSSEDPGPDLAPETFIKLFPNPNRGIFTLEAKLVSPDQQIQISVFDASGIMVFQTLENPTEEYLEKYMNLSFLPKGRYFVIVTDGITKAGQQFIIN